MMVLIVVACIWYLVPGIPGMYAVWHLVGVFLHLVCFSAIIILLFVSNVNIIYLRIEPAFIVKKWYDTDSYPPPLVLAVLFCATRFPIIIVYDNNS